MSLTEDNLIARIANNHALPISTVRTILAALRRGGSRMAQFTDVEFGGMSQWSPGMTMVGDMFNDNLKQKLNAVCTDLMAYIERSPSPDVIGSDDVSYHFPSAEEWWPSGLGKPGAVGAQNSMAYAVFSSTRRLAIRENGKVTVYDTGSHNIFGIAQAQSTDQTLTFKSQAGLVRVSDLPMVSGRREVAPVPASTSIRSTPARDRLRRPHFSRCDRRPQT